MTHSERSLLISAIVILNSYSFGANCVERFVNYQTWPLIPVRSFVRYHRAQQPLIQIFVVAPLVIGFLLQLAVLFTRPVGTTLVVAWTLFAASLAGFISTITLQVPIHRSFDRTGYSSRQMKKLLLTDWIRKAADVIRMIATIVLLRHVILL